VKIFSTITSPVFSELVVVFAGRGMKYLPRNAILATLRTMHEIRPFKLVFLLEVAGHSREARRELTEALDSVTADNRLSFLDSPPTIRITEFPDDGGDRAWQPSLSLQARQAFS